MQAEQARDLAALSDQRVAADVAAGVPDQLQGRSIGTEVGLALGVGQQSAASRVAQAWVTVRHHPRLLDRLGTGQVTMTGVRLVLKQTEALDETDRRVVDAQVADIAATDRLTPARLAQAAARCALAVDPAAATKRAATAQVAATGVAGRTPRRGRHPRCSAAGRGGTGLLDRTGPHRPRMRHDGDDRPVQTLMADLYVERLTGTTLVPAPVPAPVRAAMPPVWRNVHG